MITCCLSKVQTNTRGTVRHWHTAFWYRFFQCPFVGCPSKREYCGQLSEHEQYRLPLRRQRVLEAVFHKLCEDAHLGTRKSGTWKLYVMVGQSSRFVEASKDTGWTEKNLFWKQLCTVASYTAPLIKKIVRCKISFHKNNYEKNVTWFVWTV